MSVCSDGDVRLMDGNSNSGRVEICYNNSYSSVCDHEWDIINAGVVCRQLGFSFSSKNYELNNLTFTYKRCIGIGRGGGVKRG